MIGRFNYFNPLAVYACYLGLSKSARLELVNLIINDAKHTGKNKLDSWTGDVHGNSDLHKRKEFKNVFDNIEIAVSDYILGLGVNRSQLDVYYTRSWAVKQEGTQTVSMHDHSQSHISVCYYPHVHADSGAFVISPEELPNEFFPNLFSDNHHRETGLIDPTNNHTKAHFNIQPRNDLLLIFPSKMFHQVRPNIDNSPYPRYSISSDIVCTVKQEDRHEHCLPPLDLWQKMETKHERKQD